MKLIHLPLAAVLAAASSFACAQAQYRVHETFYQGDVFDGIITFSKDFRSITSVTGSLLSPYESPQAKVVNGIEELSNTELRPFTRQMSLTGPDGYPWGYLLSFAWDFQSSPNLAMPVFVTQSFFDPVTGTMQNFYSNSINGSNYALTNTISAVPEPATYALLLGGLGALGLLRRRKAA